jgi:hypothetical protein
VALCRQRPLLPTSSHSFFDVCRNGAVWVVRRKSTLVRKAEAQRTSALGQFRKSADSVRLRYEIRLIHKADIGASDPEDSCRALRSIAV